jgi:carbamoyl-phosphate synthase small subunit
LEQPEMAGADLVGEVTTAAPYTVDAIGENRFTVAAIDLGIKRNTPRRLAARGITTTVLPATADVDDIDADAVFLSNGPATRPRRPRRRAHRAVLERGIPLFGICFGNQVLGPGAGLRHVQAQGTATTASTCRCSTGRPAGSR